MAGVQSDLHAPHRGLPADVIPLQYHAQMLTDDHRIAAFEQAISVVARPGIHVLDLGAGTGVLSYFAARQGARVTAIEREPAVYAVAKTALAAATGDSVRVLHADARDYTPDTPVDVVICEMLHVGLLRERQIEVIRGLHDRYRAAFPGRLPRFLPEACVQAVQPVEQNFTFSGYTVAVPLFQHSFAAQPRTVELGRPRVYQRFYYDEALPVTCEADLDLVIDRPGSLNAIRIITKNILIGRPDPPGSVCWLMGYLIVPLTTPLTVSAADRVRLTFRYRPGDEITVLMATATVARRVAVVGHPPNLLVTRGVRPLSGPGSPVPARAAASVAARPQPLESGRSPARAPQS